MKGIVLHVSMFSCRGDFERGHLNVCIYTPSHSLSKHTKLQLRQACVKTSMLFLQCAVKLEHLVSELVYLQHAASKQILAKCLRLLDAQLI